MIGKRIHVLDHGFVELVDVMGDDSAIVQAARTSFGNDSDVKTYQEDRSLIRYLLRHYHTTPFEMVEFKFHAKMPILTARQWIRHRTANVNEVSGRYSELPEEYYVPKDSRIQEQSTSNKQGSGEQMGQSQKWADEFNDEAHDAFVAYKSRIDAGMAKELARTNLPLSTYSRWYWKCDLHNIFNFLRLRMDSHAQEEIRVYANAMAEFVRWRCPIAWEAFEDYRLNAVSFSASEQKILAALLDREGSAMTDLMANCESRAIPNKREIEEFRVKIQKMVARRGE